MSKDSKLTINTKRLEEHVFVMFSNINICLSLIFTDYHQHPNDRFEHFKKVSLFNYTKVERFYFNSMQHTSIRLKKIKENLIPK